MEKRAIDRPGISASIVFGSAKLAGLIIPLKSVERKSAAGISANLLKGELKKRAAVCKKLAEVEEELLAQLGCRIEGEGFVSYYDGKIFDPEELSPDKLSIWGEEIYLAVSLECALRDSVRCCSEMPFWHVEQEIKAFLALK